MASNDALTNLNGNYKILYGELVDKISPKPDYLHSTIKYRKDKKVGLKFQQPVVLGDENAITYAGSDTSEVTYETPTGMLLAPAEITPNTYYNRVRITYPAATRAESDGPAAYMDATSLVLMNGQKALQKRHSISMIYGRHTKGIGQVAIGAGVSVDSTTMDFVFTEQEWAPGIWRRLKNCRIQTTNASQVIDSGGASDVITISRVTHSTRTVRVTFANGTLKTAVLNRNATEVLNCYFYGSVTNDMVGMCTIFGNTASTVFAIDAQANAEWQGNPFAVGNKRLTGNHVQGFASVLQDRGMEEEDLVLFCSNRTWADLHSELQSARVWDSSYQTNMAKQGFNAIRYFSASGWIQVVGSTYMKGGDALMFPTSIMSRIGSKDQSFSIPGAESNPWHDVPNVSSAELILMTDMGLFCEFPAWCAYISGITNERTVAG